MLLIRLEIEDRALSSAVAATLDRDSRFELADAMAEEASLRPELYAEPAAEVTEAKPLVAEERAEPTAPVAVPMAEVISLPTLLTIDEMSWVAPRVDAATRRTGVEIFMLSDLLLLIWIECCFGV